MANIYTIDYQQQMIDLSISQSNPLAPGFMTPNASLYEGRRDSTVSSQSSVSQSHSYNSDFSHQSEFTIPLTPCSHRSPFADDAFMAQYQQRPESEFGCNSLDSISQA